MISNPALGDYLLKLFKERSADSLDSALRAVYDLGAADQEREMAEGVKIGGTTPVTIDGPSGPDAPFVPTSATPAKPVW